MGLERVIDLWIDEELGFREHGWCNGVITAANAKEASAILALIQRKLRGGDLRFITPVVSGRYVNVCGDCPHCHSAGSQMTNPKWFECSQCGEVWVFAPEDG